MTDDLAAFLDAESALVTEMRKHEPRASHNYERSLIHESADALDALVGMVRAVLALHKPWRIYDECEHSHDEDDPARVDCGDFTSCEASFMYEACAECCQENGYMTEHCADCHDHGPGKPRCPTLSAIPPTPTAEETR